MNSLVRRWRMGGAAAVAMSLGALMTLRARAADEPKPPSAERIAAVKHLMAGMNGPHCGAIGELLKGEGPKDDKAWTELALHAALLNESGFLLTENGRCPDGVWADASAALRKGAAGVFEAAGRKDAKAAQENFSTVTTSCQTCHAKFKNKPAVAAAAVVADTGKPAAGAASESRLATVRHLMAGINAPNCSGLVEALKNEGPKDDKAWQDVIRFASLLNEAGFLLTENKRCPDDTWKVTSSDLRENSAKVAHAGSTKNLDDARTGLKGVTAACAACHQVHKKPTS